ncbi:MAG: hypothetical protein JXR51_01780 [Bacteroidales bacterium]|nr:hypothetical protein [Bacteroidales bacterium]MBN2755875.1 hypothetical protein [Bacteroidales bacterium]
MRAKFTILLIFFYLPLISVNAQNKKANTFKEELNYFRFSLYTELDKISSEKIRNLDFTENKDLAIKIDSFLLKNNKQISEYQNNILEEYTVFDFDLYNYKKIENTNFDELNSIYVQYINLPVYKIAIINPFAICENMISVYQSTTYSTAEYAGSIMKGKIAQAIIKTIKTDKNEWKIIINQYYFAYEFSLNTETNEFNILKIYKRNE